MSYFLYGLVGLAGGALGMYLSRRSRLKDRNNFRTEKGLPDTTLGCLEFVWQQNDDAEWYGDSSWEFKAFTPKSAYALAWLAWRIDPEGALLGRMRARVARKFVATQTTEGYFDAIGQRVRADFSLDMQLQPHYQGRQSQQYDYELYDMANIYLIVRLLKLTGVALEDEAALVGWIQQAQSSEGRFATEARYNDMYAERTALKRATELGLYHPQIGARPYWEMEETALAVLTLAELGAQPRDREACLSWIHSHQMESGHFEASAHPDYELYRLEHDERQADQMDNDLQDTVEPRPEEDTPWAVLALDALGERPSNLEGCIRWMEERRRYPNPDWTGVRWKDGATGARQWNWDWDAIKALYRLGWQPSEEELQVWLTELRGLRTGGLFPLQYVETWEVAKRKKMEDPPFPLLSFDNLIVTYETLSKLELIGGLDEAYLQTMRQPRP